jgi:hypothetical protein
VLDTPQIVQTALQQTAIVPDPATWATELNQPLLDHAG